MNRSKTFLILCIPFRCLLAYLTNKMSNEYLSIMGYIYGVVSIGFMYAYVNNLQKTPGIQGNIWWHDMRPVFSLIYLGFSILAITQNRNAYKWLYFDVIVGLTTFLVMK